MSAEGVSEGTVRVRPPRGRRLRELVELSDREESYLYRIVLCTIE
jgi:hypothetical protein